MQKSLSEITIGYPTGQSLLNKDYTKDIPEYSLIGGTPAKFIKGNISRIWNGQTEVKLREYFTQSGAQTLEVDDSTPLK